MMQSTYLVGGYNENSFDSNYNFTAYFYCSAHMGSWLSQFLNVVDRRHGMGYTCRAILLRAMMVHNQTKIGSADLWLRN